MIEVDVFWSFSFGAVFAACSAGTLKNEETFWSTPSFVYTLLFLSLIFAPSGLYLLWDNPGWESMFVLGDKNEIHAILPTVFAFTNVLLGIIGYYITYSKIRQYRHEPQQNMTIHKYWIHAYTCFTAILGMGYNRFLYPADYVAWRAGTTFPMTDFLNSRILFTLLAMGVVLLPGMSTVSVLFSAYVVGNFEVDSTLSITQNVWHLFDDGNVLSRDSQWSPLLGFWVAEAIVMLLVSLPVYFIPSIKAPPVIQKTLKTQ
ncbi:hypothetical protein BGZ50_006851 [Haplosporangium sp. Z 11]|nr:hypothetical protein BGZ50_006851 [Haplosporangium sp. Z 11]